MKKSDLSRQKMIRALQLVLAREGLHGTTFQSVAAAAGVSQALVVKAFGNRDEMIWAGFEHLIAEAREKTAESVSTRQSVRQGLEDYVRVSIDLFMLRDSTPRMYVLLQYLASFDKRYIAFNTEIKKFAVARIQEILQADAKHKKLSHLSAKVFHSALTGLLINSVTEKPEHDLRELGKELITTFLGAQ